ncbi:MAG: PAS domain S-box protein, partial [Candidatus Hermodarchaeota archaeon]
MDLDKKLFSINEKSYSTVRKFLNLINLIDDTVIELDPNGMIIDISPQCFGLYGFTPNEMIGENSLDFVHPEDVSRIKNEMIRAKKSAEIVSVKYRALHKQGYYFPVIAKGNLTIIDDKLRLIGTIKKSIKSSDILNKVILDSNKAKNISELSRDIVNSILEIMNFDAGGIYILSEDKKIASITYYKNLSREFIEQVNHLNTDDKRYRKVFIDGEPIFIENYNNYDPEPSRLTGILSIASIPLKYKDEIVGALNIASKTRYIFSNAEKNTFNSIGKEIGNIIVSLQVHEKLKASEENYRLITENSNDLIRLTNDKFEIEYINEAAHLLVLGYKKEDLLGKISAILNHPEDYSHIRRFMRKVYKTGEGIHETRFRHKDGHYLWFEIKVKSFKDESENQKYLYISRNITERKKAELALKDSEEKYRLISENAYDLIAVLNQNFEFDYLNEQTYLQVLKYKKSDLIGKYVGNYIHPKDVNLAINELKEGFKKGYGSAEVRFKHKDGHWIWIEAKGKTFIDTNGEKKALIIARDITDRIMADQEKKFLSSITQQVKDAIIVTNQDFRITYINKATKELYGYKKKEFLGKTPDFLNAEPLAEDIQNDIYKTVLAKRVWTGFHLNRRKDGSVFICDMKISPLLDDNGQIISFIAIMHDITHRKETERKLKESRNSLAEAQKMVHLGNWWWDVKTGEVKWSEEVYNIFRLDPKEFTPQIDSILALSPWPEDHQ